MVEETGDGLIYTGLMLAEEFGVISEQTMVSEEVQICSRTLVNVGLKRKTEVMEDIFKFIVSFCGVLCWQPRCV